MKWVVIALLTFLILQTGCALVSPDEPAIRLRTDREAYDLETSGRITVDAKNVSTSVIYFNTCMPTTLEELRDGDVVASMNFAACRCLCRAELKPGETWTHIVYVDFTKDRLRFQEDRTYRLRLAFYHDREMKRLLDQELLYTNRFRLEP